MIAVLFWSLALFAAICTIALRVVDHLVRRDALGPLPELMLAVGTWAETLGILSGGATIGVGLAWWLI